MGRLRLQELRRPASSLSLATVTAVCFFVFNIQHCAYVASAWTTTTTTTPVVVKVPRYPAAAAAKQSLSRRCATSSSGSNSAEKSSSPFPSEDNKNKKKKESGKELTLKFSFHSSIAEIPADDWNACLTSPSSSPFLQHSWLHCLETSLCVSPTTGWMPQHLSIRLGSTNSNDDTSSNNNNKPIGYIPMYIKGHSMGEFIFDDAFAEAAYQNNIQYYPKLLIAVPFTPATGQRILWHPSFIEEDDIDGTDNNSSNQQQQQQQQKLAVLRGAVGKFLQQLAHSNQLSSVHCNFLTDEEATDLGGGPLILPDSSSSSTVFKNPLEQLLGRRIKSYPDNTFMRRTSIQYHWMNQNPNKDNYLPFTDFDDYLSCFKSKKRIKIKRERTYVKIDQGIHIQAIAGKDILNVPGLVDRMFDIYKSTIDKMYWGRQYLKLEFFQHLAASDFVDYLCFIVCTKKQSSSDDAKETHDSLPKAEDVFAGTVNIVKDGVFFGRYWGCLEGYHVKNLHFETCYWSAIEYCINNGLRRMEPGAGGGDYKWTRGFDPAITHSVHYFCHPGLRRAVGQYLDYETENNMELTDYLLQRSAVRSSKDTTMNQQMTGQ